MSKIKIYLDCDDTILNSSQTVINILNSRYGTNKNFEDLKDWGYRSIVKTVTGDEINEIYDSDEFWETVTFKEDFKNFYQKHKNSFRWVIVTKGNTVNLEKKRSFLDNLFQDNYDFVPLNFNIESGFDKSSVDMSEGIQIDDKTECLIGTSAVCKILIKNYKSVYWNKTPMHETNIYAVNDWKEIEDILMFFKKHKRILKECYE